KVFTKSVPGPGSGASGTGAILPAAHPRPAERLGTEVPAVPIEVDVAVVGGGPSGAASAHYLAARGHSVLVCEKKSFPREKTCGDGLTPRAVKALGAMGIGDELDTWERVKGLRVHAAGRTLELDFPALRDFCD